MKVVPKGYRSHSSKVLHLKRMGLKPLPTLKELVNTDSKTKEQLKAKISEVQKSRRKKDLEILRFRTPGLFGVLEKGKQISSKKRINKTST